MKQVSILLIIAAFLAACSSSPTLEQSAEFGKSASTVANAYASAQQTEVDLIKVANVESGACDYLRDARLMFPVRQPDKSSAAIKEQVLFLKAVEEYATALSQAVDPAGVKKLEAAGDGFAVSAAGFVEKSAASQGGAVSPVVAPAIKTTTSIGIRLFDYGLRRRVREVVEKTDNVLKAGAIKLIQDVEKNKSALNTRYAAWLERKQCTLNRLREMPTTGAELYHEYVDANGAAEQFQSRIKVLDRTGEILGKLLDAHYALLSDDIDLKATLAEFRKLAGELDLLRTAIAKA
ncbi:hypothetical protein [Taklimakanibacter lacteus]|uniref:hypothetical protein n=1 Tax=Taklimakanibacter lacteus TaxID=2268456 RepID=UPI000E661A87